jgi:hypothetical protein
MLARIAVLALVAATQGASLPAPTELRLEYLPSPVLGVTELQPRFGWNLGDTSGLDRGTNQVAYSISVTNTDTSAVVWDSGTVASDHGYGVVYNGTALKAETAYSWSVKWSSGSGIWSETSSASFEMGLPAESDWEGAQWIGSSDQKQFRVAFDVPAGASIKRARAYIAAPGCHSIYANGKAGGDELGVCPWTQFGHTVLYQPHDLTSLLKTGPNAIGLYIGNGMYTDNGGKGPTVKAKVTIDYTVGADAAATQRMVIVSAGAAAPPAPSPGPTPPLPKPTKCTNCGTVKEGGSLKLACRYGIGDVISEVLFASFGTPRGSCEWMMEISIVHYMHCAHYIVLTTSYSLHHTHYTVLTIHPPYPPGTHGAEDSEDFAIEASCHAALSMNATAQLCLGKTSCTLEPKCKGKVCHLAPSAKTSIKDPCNGKLKHFNVAIKCAPPPSPTNSTPTASSRAASIASTAGAAARSRVASYTWKAANGPLRTVNGIKSDDPFIGTTTDLRCAHSH